MYPMTVVPTRRPPVWRGPALIAAVGLAVAAMYLLRRKAGLPWAGRCAG